MTTIAFRDGILAADRQATAGNTVSGRACKIRKVQGEGGAILIAAAGSASLCRGFLDWVLMGMSPEHPPVMKCKSDDDSDVHSAGGFIFYAPNRMLTYTSTGWDEMEVDFYADGSGGDVASGAMRHGASAIEAVRAASEVDVYTGEGIDWVALPGYEPKVPQIRHLFDGANHDLLARPAPPWRCVVPFATPADPDAERIAQMLQHLRQQPHNKPDGARRFP